MRFLLVTIFGLTFYSCNSPKQDQDGWKLATEFHANCATEFIQNDELQKYSYNPRSQFYYLSDDESRTFRCLNRDSVELLIINFGSFDVFQREFKIKLDTIIDFERAKLVKELTDFRLVMNDTVSVKIKSIGKDPVLYFSQLRKTIREYGIITYGQIRLGGIIKVYLTAYDYLIYFPTGYKIEEQHFEEYWQNKKKSGKKLDNNWYYYKSKKPLNFG